VWKEERQRLKRTPHSTTVIRATRTIWKVCHAALREHSNVTSEPSAALRLATGPDAVCTLTIVDAFVIEGMSATAVTAEFGGDRYFSRAGVSKEDAEGDRNGFRPRKPLNI
jgi:hypothetical protein